MERRVVITGLGTISPVVNTVADFWNSLIEGKSGLNFIQGYDDVDLPVRIVAQVKDFDPMANGLERADVRKMDLYCQYAVAAANQAVADSGLVSGENIEPDRFGVYVGSGIGGINTFVRETEKLVKNIQNEKKNPTEGAKKIDPQLEAIYRGLEEQMKSILGTKVFINPKDEKKGKLEIEYYSQEELDRIIDLIRTVEK